MIQVFCQPFFSLPEEYADATHYHYIQQSFTESDSDSAEQPAAFPEGNWGKKAVKGAQFVRKGKMAAWGPTRGEWEVRLKVFG